MAERHCCYQSPVGQQCESIIYADNYCYWHHPTINRKGIDLIQKLEDYAHSGGLLQGINLKYANLEGINLVNRNNQNGYDLSYADLYRVKLNNAHLFNLTLTHGSLMKADLRGANLHCCDLSYSNLLGIKLDDAKIDNIKIGHQLKQEQIAYQALNNGKLTQALDQFEQSEEIYRNLRKISEHEGLFEQAGQYGRLEMIMRRYQYPLWSSQRISSKFTDLFCGYGERPINVIIFSLSLILICAFGYYLLGVQSVDRLLIFDPKQSIKMNLVNFLNCLYFSIVTFTTLGYGDITPVGVTRGIAAIEAFMGNFTLALFVVVFVKKMTR